MSNPILSICIPTYNRASSLEKCLKCIELQMTPEILKEIELVVSNNGSDDDTDMVIRNFLPKFKNFSYNNNEYNLGFDKNVDIVLSRASGEFCWTLGDDDFLEEGGIGYVLDKIKKYRDCAGLVVDNKKIEGSIFEIYDNGSDFLKKRGLLGGLISQLIFRRENIIEKREKYFGNFWFHYSIFFEAIVRGRVLVIGNVFLPEEALRECRWAKGGQVFFTFTSLKNIVKNLKFLGYDSEVVGKLLSIHIKNLPATLASAKIYGLKISRSNFRILIREYYSYPFILLISVLVFFLPTPFLNSVKSIKNNFYG